MSNLTTFTRNKIIDHVFRTGTYAKIGTYYFALTVLGVEVVGGNYARVAVTPSDANFAAPSAATPSGRKTSNANAVTFNAPNAAWGTVDGWELRDAASGGNTIASGVLTNSKVIGANDPAPSFPAGSFIFRIAYGTTIFNDLVLNFLFRSATWSKPAALFWGLYTLAPTEAGGGTECIGGAYGRVSVTPLDAAFAAPIGNDGHTENLADIVFPQPLGGNWGGVLAQGVSTALSGGNLWFFKDFPVVNVNDGDSPPRVVAGQFDFTINP